MFETGHFDSEKRIWFGEETDSIFNSNVSVGRVILRAYSRYPDSIVQISDDDGKRITGREMKLLSIRAAQNLLKIGIKKRDVVGFAVRNSTYVTPIAIAAFTIGAPINALDPSFNLDDTVHMFGQTKPKIVFCDSDLYETMKNALKEIGSTNTPIYVVDQMETVGSIKSVHEILTETGTEHLFRCPLIGDGTKEVALIVCSSGTTGLPKGVCSSHAHLLEQIDHVNIDAVDVLFTFSTLYWISGWIMFLIGTTFTSTRIITTKPGSPALFGNLIEKYKISTVLLSPSLLKMFLDSDLSKTTDCSSIKLCWCGGASISSDLYKRSLQYFPANSFEFGYGMSETGFISNSSRSVSIAIGSVGGLGPKIQVKIVDDKGRSLNINEKGEVFVKCVYPFTGYYNKPEITNVAYDKDGWFHTGDIGYFDVDRNLFLCDRKKEMIKYRSYQIAPSELESVIEQHPNIFEVCVIGIPDELSTDLPAAVISSKDGKEINKKEILDLVASKMSQHKQLFGGVYQIPVLPKTPSYKIKRTVCKEIAIKLYKTLNS